MFYSSGASEADEKDALQYLTPITKLNSCKTFGDKGTMDTL